MRDLADELEQCASACASVTLAKGIAACARLLTARSSFTATHKFFSVDFQIFSKMTVSDVFQILEFFEHTHLGEGQSRPFLSLFILPSRAFWQAASFSSLSCRKANLAQPVKMSRPCSRIHFPPSYHFLYQPQPNPHGCFRHRLRCLLADAQCQQLF